MAKVTVVSGIRDLAKSSHHVVELATLGAASQADELRIGGALGVDTVALEAACDTNVRKAVYVPFTVAKQPKAARAAIERCADEIVALKLGSPRNKGAYLQRNYIMLAGAQRLVAFTDGRETGGTAATIRKAKELGVETLVVPVSSSKVRLPNPWLDGALSAPLFSHAPYVSGRGKAYRDWRSELVRRLKYPSRGYSRGDLHALAQELAHDVATHPDLEQADAIVLVPRKEPGTRNDLVPLAEELSALTGKPLLPNWLERVNLPRDGTIVAYRERFTPAAHARSMEVVGDPDLRSVIVLDNVVTTGSTIEGAFRAIERDTDVVPVGLTVLYGENVRKAA